MTGNKHLTSLLERKNYKLKPKLTDRVCQRAVATSEINTDVSVHGNVDMTIGTVVTVTDTLEEIAAGWHLVWCNTVRERTVS